MPALNLVTPLQRETLPFHDDFSRSDRLCCDALRHEVLAWPKPGLVSPFDSGSHHDMKFGTFLASIAALEGTFAEFSRAAALGGDYTVLQAIGLTAERRMQEATGGINTHRGAIFNLGLLAAAAAYRRTKPALVGLSCGEIVALRWGEEIVRSRSGSPSSHGNSVFGRFAVGGARAEGGGGFPTVYRLGVPTLRRLLVAGYGQERALLGALLALMESLADTNLLWRGGEGGLAFARSAARQFNAAGGVEQPGWRDRLVAMHRDFVARNLSPGGSADLVAAAWVAYHLDLGGD